MTQLSKAGAVEICPILENIDRSAAWTAWTKEQILSDLPLKWEISLVARSGGFVSGFLLASKKDAGVHIHRLVVARDQRGKGIGQALIQGLNDRLRVRSDIRPVVTLKVESENKEARRFYRACGFRSRLHVGDASLESLWRKVDGMPLTYGVHQPNYLPWQGYFAKIIRSDVFVVLDDVQMPQGRSYVSRTRIRKGEDEQWLTVPVSKAVAPINQIMVSDSNWGKKHIALLMDRYRRWPFFRPVIDIVQEVYAKRHEYLWQTNLELINAICSYVNVDRVFEMSSSMDITETSDDRIISIGQHIGATSYLSGMGGMNYQSAAKFSLAGMDLDLLKVPPLPTEIFSTEIPRMGYSILEMLFALPAGEVRRVLSDSVAVSRETEQ